MSTEIRRLLEELHGYVAAMPVRVERLGGQRTSYVQRATLLDWLEVELEKRLTRPAVPSPADPQPEGSRCGKCGQPCAYCATRAGHPSPEAQKDDL